MNDFDLIEHQFENEIKIVGLSDLHIGAKNCMTKEIENAIKEICENENTYCILNGDIIDNGIINKNSLGVLDNIASPMQQINIAVEMLRHLVNKNKILAVVSGNHESRTEKITDINPLYLICCELGIQHLYRSNLAILKIKLGNREDNKRATYIILCHHGCGTAENITKKGNDFLNTFENVDVLVVGHTHAPRCAKYMKRVIDSHNNNVIQKETSVIVCNSFLNESDYALKGMMKGTSHSLVSFKLCKPKKVMVQL